MDASSKRNGKKILRSLGLAIIIALSVSYYLRTRAHGKRTIYSRDTISLEYLWLGGDRLLINTGKTTALLFAFDDNQNPGDFKIHILTMDVNDGVIGSDRIVPLPANVDTSNLGIDPFNVSFNAVLSPDKKQIAYFMPSTPKPMFPHSRAFASVRNNLTRWHVLQPPPDTAIWISDIDGSHMRVINQWSQGTDIDYDLEWRPDSKALSWMRMKGTQPTSTPRTSTQSISIQGTMQIGTLQGGATQVSIQGEASHNIYSIQMLPL